MLNGFIRVKSKMVFFNKQEVLDSLVTKQMLLSESIIS